MNSFISNFNKQYKKVLFELLGFVLLLFIFDRLLFALIQGVESTFYKRVSPYSLSDKFSQVRNKDEYKILILGTSRTYDGIHSGYFRNLLGVRAFKEAFVGKGPMYNYYFYREYKKALGIPRVVIYGLDYFLYNITTERHWMQRFDTGVIDALYGDRGVFMLLANKARTDQFLNTVLNNLQKDLGSDKNLQIEQDIFLMENYLGVSSAGDIDTQEPPSYNRVFFFSYPGLEGVYFSRLLEELQRDKVTVLLVSLPEHIGTYRTNKSHRRYLRAFKYYQRKYPNVYFLNYNLVKKFDIKNSKYFIDGGYGKTNSHLSRAGSEIVNRMLVEDLRQCLLKNEIQKQK